MTRGGIYIHGPGDAPADAFYFAATHQDLIDLGARYHRLPAIAAGRQAAFLADYQTLVGAQITANAASPFFWYTALATKNIWHSCLYLGLEHLWRLDRLLAEDDHEISIVATLPATRELIAALARMHGRAIHDRSRPEAFGHRLKRHLRGPIAAFRYLASLCNQGRGPRDLAQDAPVDLILVSVFLPEKLKPDGGYRDIFFGVLPDRLQAAGKKPLIFGQISGDSEPFSSSLLRAGGHPMRSLVHTVGRLDALMAVSRAATAVFRCESTQSALDVDVAALVKLDLSQGRWQDIPVGLLIETALVRLLDAHPAAQLMHIYENNRWEYACRRAADRRQRFVTGYQHNAVIRSHLKMQVITGQPKPLPDRIVTTGPAARRILIEQMGHDPATVVAGCALRLAPLPPADLYRRSGQLRRILVLLQGLAILPHFYDALQRAFAAAPQDLQVTLRPHPGFSVTQMIGNTSLKMSPPFVESREPDLIQDLLQHDAAVYGGSTAAMEAVGLGVPAVHLDLGDPLDVDPLFFEPALATRVENPEDLLGACRRLAEMPAEAYIEQAARARSYIEAYFAPPADDILLSIIAVALRRGS